VLNPALTLPLLLLGRYTTRGNILAEEHATAFKHLRTIFGLGLIRSLSAWLDDAVTNNWSNDTYEWSKEVVVVTGGSDGIGKAIVHLLAERGIKVAVLDVQELIYEGKKVPRSSASKRPSTPRTTSC
jgi:pyruvate/2-oxoacid:ferredoxin oxidoreductase alpha subunit